MNISIDTTVKLYAYCVDFGLDVKDVTKELDERYAERTRSGCNPIPYDQWFSEALKLKRIDKEMQGQFKRTERD